MDAAMLVVGIVGAFATLASVYFAWRAADAARLALTEARSSRSEEQRALQAARLGTVAGLIGEVNDAHMAALGGEFAALNRGEHARGRLRAAIAATGLDLQHATEVVQGAPHFAAALDEVAERIADQYGLPPG